MTLQRESPSTSSRLHETISSEAQRLVDGDDSIHAIHADIVELVDEYRGHLPDRAKDRHAETDWRAYFNHPSRGNPAGDEGRFDVEPPSKWPGAIDLDAEKLKRLRIVRETVLAATSRVMGDVIIQKVLGYSSDDGIDMCRMMESYHPRQYYNEGMLGLLDETVDKTIAGLGESRHPHHELFKLTAKLDYEYLDLLKDDAKRTGAKMKTWNSIYNTLHDMFVLNYQDLIEPLVVTHGISIQNHYPELPDSETLADASAQARPHWLALATMSRVAFQNILFGEDLYPQIVAHAEYTGTFPTWLSSWSQGISRAIDGIPNPFVGCPLRSPLVDRAPDDPIEPFKSPGHCSGNFTLTADSEANDRANEFFNLVGSPIEGGRYVQAALTIDLGRIAATYAYADSSFRRALIMGRRVCDEVRLALV